MPIPRALTYLYGAKPTLTMLARGGKITIRKTTRRDIKSRKIALRTMLLWGGYRCPILERTACVFGAGPNNSEVKTYDFSDRESFL